MGNIRYNFSGSKFFNLGLIILLFLLVVLIQMNILLPSFSLGFTRDDWMFIYSYRLLGMDPILKIFDAWQIHGAHFTYRVFSAGIPYHFFGLNYFAFHFLIALCKVCAVMSLYLVILAFFRNRLLAFLTTIIYAVSFSTLETVKFTTGIGDFLGATFMNLFLTYYYINIDNWHRQKVKTISLLLLFTSFILSPVRIYPILVIIPFVELLHLHNNLFKVNYFKSLIRMGILYLPFLITGTLFPGNVQTFAKAFINLYNIVVTENNWHIVVSPITTLGYMFLPQQWWIILPRVYFKSFFEYFYLFLIPTIAFLILPTLIFALFIKKKLSFISGVSLINLFILIIIFFLVVPQSNVVQNYKVDFNLNVVLIGIITGVFSLSLALNFLRGYLIYKKERIYLGIFSGLFFALVFIISTWLFANYYHPVWAADGFFGLHGYLMIPAMGTSLFLAGIILYFFEGFKKIFKGNLRILIFIPFLLLLPLFHLNQTIASSFFSYQYKSGMLAVDQEKAYQVLVEKIKITDLKRKIIFYFDTSDPSIDSNSYLSIIWGRLEVLFLNVSDVAINECDLPIKVISDFAKLKSSTVVLNNTRGFLWKNRCDVEVFININDFYAYKIENKSFIDIKNKIINEAFLGSNHD